MTTQPDRKIPSSTLSARAVADYLRDNPDFFVRHPSLTAQLEVPHDCGGAVSLIEHQVHVLREQNTQLRGKLKELVQAGRDNDRLSERTLRLTLALMDASGLEGILTGLEDSLYHDFKADAVSVRLFSQAQAVALHRADQVLEPGDPGLALFDTLFKNHRPLCGRLKQDQLEFLFGEAAENLGSAALVALGDRGDLGLLAIGSRDPGRFHPGMGTIFLTRVATLVTHALQKQLATVDDG